MGANLDEEDDGDNDLGKDGEDHHDGDNRNDLDIRRGGGEQEGWQNELDCISNWAHRLPVFL